MDVSLSVWKAEKAISVQSMWRHSYSILSPENKKVFE